MRVIDGLAAVEPARMAAQSSCTRASCPSATVSFSIPEAGRRSHGVRARAGLGEVVGHGVGDAGLLPAAPRGRRPAHRRHVADNGAAFAPRAGRALAAPITLSRGGAVLPRE